MDTAVCTHLASHKAPSARCTCGFYAVHDLLELHRFAPVPPEAVCLEVLLGGHMVMHEFGCRASAQMVRAIRPPERCARCGRGSPVSFRLRRRSFLYQDLVPVCTLCAHSARHSRLVPFTDVAVALGCPVQEPVHISPLWPRASSWLRCATVLSIAGSLLLCLLALGAPGLLAVAVSVLVGYVLAVLSVLTIRSRLAISGIIPRLRRLTGLVLRPWRYTVS